MEVADEHHVVTVEDGESSPYVVIRNTWRTHYPDAAQLGDILSDLIRQALPAGNVDEPGAAVREPRTMSRAELDGFWQEFNAWREAGRRLRNRARSEAPGDVVQEDPRNRIRITWRRGRLQSLALDPAWLENASIQGLNDTINEFLQHTELPPEVPADPDLERMNHHRDNALRYLG